jgi:hypothetical protein
MLNCLVTQVVVDGPVCVLARVRQRVTAGAYPRHLLPSADFPLWTVLRVRLHIEYAKVLLPSRRSKALLSQGLPANRAGQY